ncbi:hypothetical protein FB451DRAFT_1403729 [Mycena latifolia]|nr:hypothetical protein FB451DRAFT_1403729 [Mycena latifolia]
MPNRLQQCLARWARVQPGHRSPILALRGPSVYERLITCCVLSVAVLKLVGHRRKRAALKTTASLPCHLTVPAPARLHPDMSVPQYPFDHSRRTIHVAALPKARTAGKAYNIYRYPGNCWHQEHLAPRVQSPPSAAHGHQVPSPVHTAAQHQVSEAIVAVGNKVVKSVIAQAPEASSDRLPLQACSHARHGPAPAPVSVEAVKVKVKEARPAEPLVNWRTVKHTLELPLRGNKLARTPFVRSKKVNITINMVFCKTLAFYTPAVDDKENVYVNIVNQIV